MTNHAIKMLRLERERQARAAPAEEPPAPAPQAEPAVEQPPGVADQPTSLDELKDVARAAGWSEAKIDEVLREVVAMGGDR